MSDEEEKYIKQSESDQIARIRRQRQLEALRQEERDGIAKVLHSSDDVADAALELGFDRETARILHLVPVIQVAWADDTIQPDEREKVLTLARDRGISETSPAYEFLELLLDKKPSELFFERTNQVIAHLLERDASGLETADLLEQARDVAQAAGGFFGFGDKISDEEKELIEELTELFSR
jgi:hypothetical protein